MIILFYEYLDIFWQITYFTSVDDYLKALFIGMV